MDGPAMLSKSYTESQVRNRISTVEGFSLESQIISYMIDVGTRLLDGYADINREQIFEL